MSKNENMKDFLVSIIVISYNSSKYILNTLESIKEQTYRNIELIISDDCSTDNTVVVCQRFIEENQSVEFIRDAKIVSTEKNSGITPNYNNGLKHAQGKWIKYIAGDDLLTSDCIQTYVETAENSEDKLFVAGTYPFNEKESFPARIPDTKRLNGDVLKQFRSLVKYGTFIEGPTIFVEKEMLTLLGGFSEKYPFIEDFPLFFKFILNGYRIHLIEKPLIWYREYAESVSQSDNRFAKSLNDHYKDIIYPNLLKNKMYLFYYHTSIIFFIEKHSRDNTIWSKSFSRYLVKFASPIAWCDFYRKKIKKQKIYRP